MLLSNKQNKTHSYTSNRYKYTSAILAFIMWGSWAFYINDYSGIERQLLSGFVQGTASFIITLLMVRLITQIYNFLPNKILRLTLSPILTVTLTGTGLVFAHNLAGTQRIFSTVAPALTVALLYAIFTTIKLKTSSQKEAH